ncbi:hypothetical protein NIES25_52300 [Nostoc linckia NIES-25]|nr:hypothetical protein NIES25_52300 [Nostoc linckia NIES-25]
MNKCTCGICDLCIEEIFSPKLSAHPTIDSVRKLAYQAGKLEGENRKLQANFPYCKRKGCPNKHYNTNRYGFCLSCFEELIG